MDKRTCAIVTNGNHTDIVLITYRYEIIFTHFPFLETIRNIMSVRFRISALVQKFF